MRYAIVLVFFLTLFGTEDVSGKCPAKVDKSFKQSEVNAILECFSNEIQDLKNNNGNASIGKEREEMLQLLNDTKARAEKVSAELDELLNQYKMELEKVTKMSEIDRLFKKMRDLEINVKGKPLYVNNKCHHPISLLIKYQLPYGIWVVKGWWDLKAKTEKFLMDEDERLVVNSDEIYTYVRSTDGSDITWSGDVEVEYKNKIYKMDKEPVRATIDKYEIVMGCSYYD